MLNLNLWKGTQLQSGMQHYPNPTASTGHGDDFLPRYEEAVNANLRNFDQLEGQTGKGAYEGQQAFVKSTPRWKRCFLIILPFLLVVIAVAGVMPVVLEKHQNSPSTPVASSSSLTLTKRHTLTITKTETFSATIAPSIAQEISSFYDSWVSSIDEAMTESSSSQTMASTTPLPSINMHFTTLASSTPPLPSINLNPSTPPATSITVTTTASPPPTTVSTASRIGATGDGFCGLPGTPCLGGRDTADSELLGRDMYEGEDASDSITLVTVWKHLTLTTTSTTTSTKDPFPAYIMNAYDSYLQQGPSSILSAASAFTGSDLYSIPPSAPAPTTTTKTVEAKPPRTPQPTSQGTTSTPSHFLCIGAARLIDCSHYNVFEA